MAGRPYTYPGLEDPKIQGILKLIRAGHPQATACKKHRVPLQTWRDWCAREEQLSLDKNEAQADAQIKIYEDLIGEDSPVWSKWMTILQRRDPVNYSENVKLAIMQFESEFAEAISDLDEATRELVLERMASIDISR